MGKVCAWVQNPPCTASAAEPDAPNQLVSLQLLHPATLHCRLCSYNSVTVAFSESGEASKQSMPAEVTTPTFVS